MRIKTAIILCAGLGKRLNPITLSTPKPLLKLNDKTMLEVCINLIMKLGVKKVFINTFHLSDQIFRFIENKNFPINIQIIKEENEILNTGGGILNLINYSDDDDFIIFNPDTLWHQDYLNEITQMQNFYFSNKLNNILLLSNKDLSFDKNFLGDFTLKNNLLKKNEKNDLIYIGCQILNRSLFKDYKVSNFSISKIWNDLQQENRLNGFQSKKKFYHLTNLDVFKKLKDL
jgi:MurNAc alpha-1-phosphate uridylyltransferase